MKDKTTALILSALLGGLGVDRFYLGYPGLGVLKLLTAGCFGIMWIIDIIFIATDRLQPADGLGYADEPRVHAVSATDPYESMKKLAELKEQGIVSNEEFSRLKEEILSTIK